MKVEAILWPRINKNQQHFIKIRITEKRKSRYYNLKYSIPKRYWNEKTHRVRSSYFNYKEINDHIEFEINRINYNNSNVIDNQNDKNYDNVSFLEYFDKQLNYMEERGRYNDTKKHKVIRNHLLNYVNNKYNNEDILFSHITIDFLEGFISYFKKPERNHNNNTIKQTIAKLSFFYNKALDQKVYAVDKNPFKFINIKAKPTDNKGLEIDEFLLLDNVSPFGFKSILPEFNHREIFYTKNYFIFQIYASGIRVSDLLLLRWSNINNGYMEYKMRKTNKTLKIPLNNKLIEVLRFFLPYSYKKTYLEKYSSDFEMYLSLNDLEQKEFKKSNPVLIINPQIKKPIYSYQIDNHENILRMINGCRSTHSDKFILNIFSRDDISKLNDKSKNTNVIEHKIIQSNTTKYNKRLKKLQSLIIGGEMKLETKLTTHVARHTYASIMISTNANLTAISKTLGHTSVKTTENYLKSITNSFVFDQVSKSFDDLEIKSDKKRKDLEKIVYVKTEDIRLPKKMPIPIFVGTVYIKNKKTMILYPNGEMKLITIISVTDEEIIEGKFIGSIYKENGLGYIVDYNGEKKPFHSKTLNLPVHNNKL